MSRFLLLPVAALLLLAACAATPTPDSVPKHEVPASGQPSARLLTRAVVTPGDAFGLFVLDDNLACKGLRVASAGNATRVPAASALAADRLTTIDFRIVKPDKRMCIARWSFTPRAGRSYLVTGAVTATGCSARLLDATDPDAIKPVESALLRNAVGKPCIGLEEARAARDARPAGGQIDGEAVLAPGANAAELEGLLK